MLQLNHKYKVVLDLSHPIQGNIRTTEGVTFVQGYNNALYVYDIETGLQLGLGGVCFDVERNCHPNDPFSFDLEFNIEIPNQVEGATSGCYKIIVKDAQTIKAERYFNKEVIVVPRLKDGKVTLEYQHDYYKESYISKGHSKYITGRICEWDDKRRAWLRKQVQ